MTSSGCRGGAVAGAAQARKLISAFSTLNVSACERHQFLWSYETRFITTLKRKCVSCLVPSITQYFGYYQNPWCKLRSYRHLFSVSEQILEREIDSDAKIAYCSNSIRA